MHRVEQEVRWAAALTIAMLAITALATVTGPAVAVPPQDEEEEVEVSESGNRLVFDVKTSGRSFEAHPDGTFVHASSGASLSFDEGELLGFSGSDEERPAKVERVEVRDKKVSIHLDERSRETFVKSWNNPMPLADGVWTNKQAGTSFVVEEGSIIKCGGFEPKS